MPAPSRDIGFQLGRSDLDPVELAAAARTAARLCARATNPPGTIADLREVLAALGYPPERLIPEPEHERESEPEREPEPVPKPRTPTKPYVPGETCRSGEHSMKDALVDKEGHRRCKHCRNRNRKAKKKSSAGKR